MAAELRIRTWPPFTGCEDKQTWRLRLILVERIRTWPHSQVEDKQTWRLRRTWPAVQTWRLRLILVEDKDLAPFSVGNKQTWRLRLILVEDKDLAHSQVEDKQTWRLRHILVEDKDLLPIQVKDKQTWRLRIIVVEDKDLWLRIRTWPPFRLGIRKRGGCASHSAALVEGKDLAPG